jgi:hypothetical protein
VLLIYTSQWEQSGEIYQPRFHEYLSASLAPQIGDSAAEQCAKNAILVIAKRFLRCAAMHYLWNYAAFNEMTHNN